jgi:hypothetical protein
VGNYRIKRKEGGYNDWWVILFSESSKVLITHGGLGNEIDKGDCEIIVDRLVALMTMIKE